MAVQLAYPAGQRDPAPLIDLSVREERDRLSSDAIRAFFNIMERWGGKDSDARLLLGDMSNGA